MTSELKIDTREFMRAMARFLATSKRDHLDVMKDQARGVIRTIVAFTPPGSKGATGARGRGRAQVKGDILKLMRGTASERRVERRDIGTIHEGARRRGRVKNAPPTKIIVPARALRAYIKRKQDRVGHLASGWNEAAAKLGYKPPQWIWRHDGPGAIGMKVTDRDIRIRATNSVRYASDIDDIERRINAALHVQRRKIERRLAHYTALAARRAGFK